MDKIGITALLAFLQCGGPSQQEVRYPIFGRSAGTAAFTSRGGWDVTLTEGRIALGPIYFCTTEAASPDLCSTAQAEFPMAKTIDVLDTNPQLLGEVRGFTGTIGSAEYDFAITWTNTQSSATPLSGAVDGHSAHFEGVARRGDRSVQFVLDADLVPLYQGTFVVQGAKTGADLADGNVILTVTLDPVAWWRQVDFSEFDGVADEVVHIPPESTAANAVLIGMTANNPPVFAWSVP